MSLKYSIKSLLHSCQRWDNVRVWFDYFRVQRHQQHPIPPKSNKLSLRMKTKLSLRKKLDQDFLFFYFPFGSVACKRYLNKLVVSYVRLVCLVSLNHPCKILPVLMHLSKVNGKGVEIMPNNWKGLQRIG